MTEEEQCFIPTPENTSTFEATVRVEKKKIMKAAKEKVSCIFRREVEKEAEKEAEKTPFQGEMLTLLAQEKEDVSWQSVIFRVPRGVMAWAVRAGTQSLATPDNLARWGFQAGDKCPMEGCTARCTLGHILSICAKCLARYRYRHDSCLTYLISRLTQNKPKEMMVWADLPG